MKNKINKKGGKFNERSPKTGPVKGSKHFTCKNGSLLHVFKYFCLNLVGT
jgi:hypothetical protein